ncbi:MAG: hypothetical protein ACJ8DJ_08245 [Gemmatimonadales bacterium]
MDSSNGKDGSLRGEIGDDQLEAVSGGLSLLDHVRDLGVILAGFPLPNNKRAPGPLPGVPFTCLTSPHTCAQ